MNKLYYNQVELLLRVLPLLAEYSDFALKGGTAINLFFRDMPRLSVDIDLALIKILDRESSIKLIHNNLKSFAEDIQSKYLDIKVTFKTAPDGYARSLLIQSSLAQIKVEVNDIIRGSVYPCVTKELCDKAQEEFDKYVEIQTYSFYDLYAGKICAALDRQHPRDLFDVNLLLKMEGFNDELRKTFLIYLISHNRPIAELINPNRLDISITFKNNFEGMTSESIYLKDLEETREQIINLTQGLTNPEKEFLISFKSNNPKWNLLGLEGVDKLPAVRWKLQNISKMSPEKHEESIKQLKNKLGL